jgi:hypothetical protein
METPARSSVGATANIAPEFRPQFDALRHSRDKGPVFREDATDLDLIDYH